MLRDKLDGWVAMADSIAWDECHKIYILMDEAQTQQMRDYEYPKIFTKADSVNFEDTLLNWFEDSCDLRFISAVSTEADGEQKFHSVVEQFEDVEV